MTAKITLFSALLFLTFSPAVFAEKADSTKPINVEADRMSMDDIKKVQILEGNVILTQGTMQIRTQKLVVTQDADGFQKGVATGGANGLARFRQKRDNSDDYFEGEGERIEHDARAEKTEFFVRAWVKNGDDEIKGQYISYDALTEQYLVTNGRGDSKTASGAPQARVRAIIQPKGKNTPPPPAGEPLKLKPASSVPAQ